MLVVFALLLFGLVQEVSAQGFNAERKELSDFLTRMYKSEPFEGVRVKVPV